MSLFEQMKQPFIQDLVVGQTIDHYFKVLAVEKRTKRDGNIFLSLELMDKTGKIPAKIWDKAEYFYNFIKAGEIYHLKGSVNEYMKKKEIKVDYLNPVSPGDKKYNPNDYIEQASFDTEETFRQMISLIRKNLQNPHLLKLIDLFKNSYADKFKSHYGAQKVHHAYLGGLLQHTFNIIKMAIFVADLYQLDKELLLTGSLFHDIGKISEFTINPTLETTAEGGLIGHLVIGNNLFLELKGKIDDFPEELSLKVQHLIISHHGEKEFGSPEIPKIPEAYALHVLDLLDSKLKIFDEAINHSQSKTLFTDYIHFLNRRLYLGGESGESDGDG